MLPVPPVAATLCDPGDTWTSQAAASWFTVNARLAISIVPVRAAPKLLPTLYVSEPFPVRWSPLLTPNHEVFVVAVHVQPLPAVTITATVPLPPDAPMLREPGSIRNAQGVGGGASSCVTVNVSPAIASVPRRMPPRFRSTRKLTVPVPLPFRPPVTPIQSCRASAVQLHPSPAVTPTE
jgi:hypothetical protein